MMVKFFATLKLKLRVASVSVEASPATTVGEALRGAERELGREFWLEIFDEAGTARVGAMVLLDGVNIAHLQGVETPVGTAEALSIFPPAGGG